MAEVVAKLGRAAGMSDVDHLAPGVSHDQDQRSINVVGSSNVFPVAVEAPSRSEILEALSFGRHDDDTATQIYHLQRQMNLLLRLFLSRSSFSASPHLSSGSASPSSYRSDSSAPPKTFVCPICHEHLSEKSFVRHIQKWPGRVHSRVRKNSCPGIKSFDNIYLQRVHREPDDDLADVVQKLVDHVVRMTRPGSNAAHTAAGSGDSMYSYCFSKMRNYACCLL